MLYELPSILIGLSLLVAMLVINELGYRIGKRVLADDEERTQTAAIQGGVLGLLALLLGFSFTMGLQRHDARSQSVVQEANAIGTAALRVDLLEDPTHARELTSAYILKRIEMGQFNMAAVEVRDSLATRAMELQNLLWSHAALQAKTQPSPITGLYAASVNDLIDAYGTRDSELRRHIPVVTLLLLFLVFIVAGGIMGFASGLNQSRPRMATLALFFIIVLVITLVMDLDRPRRGIVQVDQTPIVMLNQLAVMP